MENKENIFNEPTPYINHLIEASFSYHKPTGNQPETYERIREIAKDFAYLIDIKCPDSREKSLAMTKLQESVMWANASIAINNKDSAE